MGTVFRVIPIVLHLLSLLCRAANGWRNLTVTVLLHPCSLPPVSKTSTLTKTNQQQDSQAPTPQSITIVETTTTLKRPGALITEEMAETVSSLLISDTERGYRLSFASGVGGRVTGVTSDRLWSGERLWSGMDRKDSGDNVGRNITLIFSPSSLDEMKAGVGEEEGGKTDKQHAFIFRLNDGILGRHDWGGFLSSPMLGGTVVRDGGGSAGWGRVGILEDGMLVANGSVPQEVYDGFVNAARSGWDLEGGGEISTSGTVASVFCGVKSLSINGADVLPPPRTREDRNDKRNESGQKTDNIKQDQKSPRRQTLFEILEVGSSSPLILSLSTLSSGTSLGPGLDVIFFSPEPSLDIYFHLYVEFIANLLPQGTRNSTTRFWLERCTEGYWEGGECDVFTGGKGGDIGGGGRATLVVVNAHSNKQGMSLEFFERLYRGRRAVEGDKRGLLYLLHLNHEQPLTLDVGDLRNYYDVQKLREDYKRFDGVWRHYYHPKINMGDADGENGHRDAIVRYLPLGPALRDVKETDELRLQPPHLRPLKCGFIGNIDHPLPSGSPDRPSNNRTQMASSLFSECRLLNTPSGVSDLVSRDILHLSSAFCPCPGGNNAETFRFYESLEAGCIPLLVWEEGVRDWLEGLGLNEREIWFVLRESWDEVLEAINDIYFHDDGQLLMEEMQRQGMEWWKDKKRSMREEFESVLMSVG